MTPNDRAAFNQELTGAASVLGRDLTNRDLGRYWYHLQKYDLSEVIEAVRFLEGELMGFPFPVQIKRRILDVRAESLAATIAEPRAPISDEERAIILADSRRIIAELEERMRS